MDRLYLTWEQASAILVAVFTGLGISQKSVRDWVWKRAKLWHKRQEIVQEMLDTQHQLVGELQNIGAFMYEHNRRQDLNFRMHALPAFECDALGRNSRVSDSYLELLGLRRETDLEKMDWQRFIHQEDREIYLSGFLTAASEESDYSANIRMVNDAGKGLGEKRVRIFCVTSNLFVGYIRTVNRPTIATDAPNQTLPTHQKKWL